MLNLDPTPLRIEPDRGILIINPVQNSTALKHIISTLMAYSNKNLNFIPVLFVLLLIHYVTKSQRVLTVHSPNRGLSSAMLKIKEEIKKVYTSCIYHRYFQETGTPRPLSKNDPLASRDFLSSSYFMTHLWRILSHDFEIQTQINISNRSLYVYLC